MNREVENILKKIDEYNMKDYKCYDLLKELLNNKAYLIMIKDGLRTGDIKGIPGIILDHLEREMGESDFLELFQEGNNIGHCAKTSEELSKVLQGSYYLCDGNLKLLKGTKNSSNGNHSWIQYGDYAIDTTLMLMISSKYQKLFGYVTEKRHNPEIDEPLKRI